MQTWVCQVSLVYIAPASVTDRQTPTHQWTDTSSRYSSVGLCPSQNQGSSYWVCQGSPVHIAPASVTDRQTDGQTHNLPISGLTHLPDIPQLVCVHQGIQVHLTVFVREVQYTPLQPV